MKEYNERIQAMINPPAPNKAEIQLKNSVFRVGDRIMQTKNSNDVCNGETGFIMEIKKDEDDIQICGIRFDGRNDVLWYYPEELQYITLSYAITIHKSQGSEFKSVIIPLLKSYYIMLKRNLLYTAVTRAKSKVILVGERQASYMAVNKTETDKRLTQLGRRIQKNSCGELAKASSRNEQSDLSAVCITQAKTEEHMISVSSLSFCVKKGERNEQLTRSHYAQ